MSILVHNCFANCIAQAGALYLYNDNNNNHHRLCGGVRLRREAKTVNRPNQNVKFIAVWPKGEQCVNWTKANRSR